MNIDLSICYVPMYSSRRALQTNGKFVLFFNSESIFKLATFLKIIVALGLCIFLTGAGSHIMWLGEIKRSSPALLSCG